MREKAEKLIPSCSQTFSKSPSQFVQNVAPVFLDHGKGSRVWDVDGNEYIDHILALGPVILGYAYPAVDEAIKEQIKKGISFSLPHSLELEVAEMLVDLIPCAEMVRFGKNGSDVTTGAIRVARAYTGKDKVAVCGYHGWHDWYIAMTTRDKGVPSFNKDLCLRFTYNDIGSLERIFSENKNEVAAVIMEGVCFEEPKDGFLEKVEKLSRENGSLLIFDEVINGFRIAPGGAHEYYGIDVDLAAFGKAIANGMPLSAIVGKKEIMKLFNDIFYSFTFGGETLSLAAAKATLTEFTKEPVIERINEKGRKLKEKIEELIKKHDLSDLMCYRGLDAHAGLKFNEIEQGGPQWVKSLFQQEMIADGVLTFGASNLSYSHSDEDIDHTVEAVNKAFEMIKRAKENGNDRIAYKELLKADPIYPVFTIR
jgi:glutamate-1-semialdehyde aminotransferase